MCLRIKKHFRKHIAKSNFIVYKMIKVYEDETMSSPYQDSFKWKLNKIYTPREKPYIESWRQRAYSSSERVRIIHSGFFHACISLNEMREYYAWDIRNNNWKCTECIIPKGSIYYLGVNNDIATRKLKITKIL